MPKQPTHAELTRFISSFLPPKSNDVSLLYHVPRAAIYNFETAPVQKVVLSVTPTTRIYEAIGQSRNKNGDGTGRSSSQKQRIPNTVCFLHRPYHLDRRRVRDDALVLASHTSFDENLTVGWNLALAHRLGLHVDDCLCVQGYKGDDERKMGIIGQTSQILGPLLKGIEEEFGAIEYAQEGLSEEIRVVAIMNAFNPDEVQRVVEMAHGQNWVPSVEQLGRHVLYLTGQERESGLREAKKLGMTVVCVGHRVAEQWGIEFLGARIRAEYPGVQVKEIYEDGLPLPN